MNLTERKMLDILKELRDVHGVIAVKAEFEAEGSRTDELVKLNEIVFRADMNLYIKIGGCEAVRDLDQCRLLGAAGIMAPMIETPFAMQKFVGAAKTVYGSDTGDIDWIINAETVTCRQNYDAILEKSKGFITTVSVGRVDMSGSMGLGRDEINGEKIFEVTKDIALRTRAAGIAVNFGGGISFDAVPFLVNIAKYVDRFETRKVVFRITDNEKAAKQAIIKAMEFELLYLKNKCWFYERMANEDKNRIIMLEARFEQAKTEM